jgi:hypothetical protein
LSTEISLTVNSVFKKVGCFCAATGACILFLPRSAPTPHAHPASTFHHLILPPPIQLKKTRDFVAKRRSAAAGASTRTKPAVSSNGVRMRHPRGAGDDQDSEHLKKFIAQTRMTIITGSKVRGQDAGVGLSLGAGCSWQKK